MESQLGDFDLKLKFAYKCFIMELKILDN